MKKVIIKNLLGLQTHGADLVDPSAWIADCVANNLWGKPERWIPASQQHDVADVIEREMREIKPAISAQTDEQGNELSSAVEAVTEEYVKLRAEYTVEIEDISAQLEQDRINRESQEYLDSTDWMIIRELDAGVPCPAEVRQARAEARARIVR